MRPAARLALASVALLAACATGPGGEEPDEDRPAAPVGFKAPDLATGGGGERVWSAHWERVAKGYLRGTGDVPFVERELARGQHLSLWLLGVRGSYRAGSDAEVLIVVEGQGRVQLATGASVRLDPGTVALFPPGTRGPVVAPAGKPLLGLLVRSAPRAPASGGEAWVGTFDDVWSARAFGQVQGVHVERVGALPGGLSVHAIALGHEVGTTDAEGRKQLLPAGVGYHAHTRHDEVVLVVQGEGSCGVGSSGQVLPDGRSVVLGHTLQEGSILFIPAGASHSFRNASPRGTRWLSVFGPDQAEPVPTASGAPGGGGPGGG